MLEDFKVKVWEANRRMAEEGLVTLSWGSVSGYDHVTETVAIKPSGFSFQAMRPQDIVLLDLDGNVLEGNLKPSTDTATHCLLYKGFKGIGGICHAPARHASMFAQACRPIRCTGAMHAAHFQGDIPVTDYLTEQQTIQSYEANTARLIIETFRSQNLNFNTMPGVLVAGHGPFTWGQSADQAVDYAVAMDAIAQVQAGVMSLNPDFTALPSYILDHYHQRRSRSV